MDFFFFISLYFVGAKMNKNYMIRKSIESSDTLWGEVTAGTIMMYQ